MKKFTLLFLFFSLAVSAQVFPEYDLSYLKPGMKVEVATEGFKSRGFKHFYEGADVYENYKANGNSSSPYAVLAGRVFEITGIKQEEKRPDNYVITLKDIENNEIIYFDQRVGSRNFELLMVDNIELPVEYFCKYVTQVPNSETYGIDGAIKVIRYKNKGKTDYSITLKTLPILKNSGKGIVTINLKNDKKITRNKVTAKVTPTGGGQYESYEVTIILTKDEIALLKDNEIISYNFFSVYDATVDRQTAGVTKGAVECLVKK